MSTKMTEDDWDVALEVFRTSLPRWGDKGWDDRLFLETLHNFAVHNITWSALPERFGKWNSVWKRFDRLSKGGNFDLFFEHLASLSSTASLVQMFDSTIVSAYVSAAGAKGGQKGQALGRSRGGFTTKIHLKTDFDGLAIAFGLAGGEKGDAPHFRILLGLGPDTTPRAVVADKRYSSKANRNAARSRGAIPVIPHKTNEKDRPVRFVKAIYRGRARIEQAVEKLKRFKRVALRCEKTKRDFSAIVAIAAAFNLIKSVHTA
ncbi:IS5 family transposase [Martelella limonii]|uniref:IS5 family transposase n=1 Tax=Martelella limonii TaxID=1647649 RepID=UPI001580BED9|nr:IS5 family transposase [Martelella limonii]